MVNSIGWLAAGVIAGWLASRMIRNYALQGLLLNIAVGVLGAFLAGWVLAPLLGLGPSSQNDFSLPAFLLSLAGAVSLLAAVILLRRGSVEL